MSAIDDGRPTWWSGERRPAGWRVSDGVLAAGSLLLLVTEIAPNPDMTPHAALVATAVAMSVPIAWSTSQAARVAVLVTGAHLVMSFVSTGPFSPQTSVIPLLVVLYLTASRLRGRTAVLTGALTLALTVAAWGVTEEGGGDDFWPWMLWAGAWAAGSFVRRRADLAAHHAGRAALLEVEARTSAAESAARERDRIARELHDVVAHSVSVMVVQAGAERLRLGPDPGPTGSALEAIEETGRLALAELRTMLGVLRDRSGLGELAPLPGLAEIPALVERVRRTGVPIELSMDPPLDGDDPSTAGLAAYRIVQEALTNVVRHAGAVTTRVVVLAAGADLEVTVTNSDGAATGPPGSGRGLTGMRERAVALGGEFRAGPLPGGGFEVRARLPTRRRAPAR